MCHVLFKEGTSKPNMSFLWYVNCLFKLPVRTCTFRKMYPEQNSFCCVSKGKALSHDRNENAAHISFSWKVWMNELYGSVAWQRRNRCTTSSDVASQFVFNSRSWPCVTFHHSTPSRRRQEFYLPNFVPGYFIVSWVIFLLRTWAPLTVADLACT